MAEARMVTYSQVLFCMPESLVYALVRREGFVEKSFPMNKVRTPQYGMQASLSILSA